MVFGVARSQIQQGIRPFDPGRDLRSVADLIEVSFGNDLSAADLEVIQGIRSAAFLGPLIGVVAALVPTLRQALQGFVWVHRGRVVGNVNWGRVPGVQGYVISNVAVHPDRRRRGIARRLMERALEDLEAGGASLVSLEVDHDNLPAHQLYTDLGFETVGARTELRWHEWVAPRTPSDERDVVPLSEDRWPGYEALVASAVSESERELGAPEEIGIRAGWVRRLVTAAGWRRLTGWAVERSQELQAAVTVRNDPLAGRARLVMVVRPEVRGKVEPALLERALATLARPGRARTRALLYPSYAEGVDSLRGAGFVPIRTLERMMTRLGAGRGGVREDGGAEEI